VKKRLLIAVVLACLIGAIIAIISTSQYMRIERQGLEEKSFCAISAVIDCDIATASSYSSLAGIPIAWWGLLTYLLMGVMTAVGAFSKKEQKATLSVAWFLSLAAVFYSIRMAYALVHILGVLCLECIGMYLVNIFVAFGLWKALGIPFKQISQFFMNYIKAVFQRPSDLGFQPKLVTHAVIILITFIFGWGIMYNVMAQGPERISLKEKINAHYMQSLYAIEPDAQWPVWGNPEGKISIIEFSDFQCPFCRLAAFNIRPYLHEFKNDVRYFFVNYPLDQSCNPNLDQPMHQKACMAAYAAKCAQDRGDFWGFHDDLFRHQRRLSEETILKFAQDRKWNTADFQTCMNSEETKKRILEDIETAKRFYISGTPSIIIDGRKLKFWRDRDFLQAVVEEEIKKAKK
jgi:protein-disulfide isomerase/uncharacterized membrane protein